MVAERTLTMDGEPGRGRSRFSPREQRELRFLRALYQRDADVLSDTERARLRFIRWLHEMAGRES